MAIFTVIICCIGIRLMRVMKKRGRKKDIRKLQGRGYTKDDYK